MAEPGGADELQFLCRPPNEPCANTSRKYFGYCEHGVCCQNKLLGQEFCAYVSLSVSLSRHERHIIVGWYLRSGEAGEFPTHWLLPFHSFAGNFTVRLHGNSLWFPTNTTLPFCRLPLTCTQPFSCKVWHGQKDIPCTCNRRAIEFRGQMVNRQGHKIGWKPLLLLCARPRRSFVIMMLYEDWECQAKLGWTVFVCVCVCVCVLCVCTVCYCVIYVGAGLVRRCYNTIYTGDRCDMHDLQVVQGELLSLSTFCRCLDWLQVLWWVVHGAKVWWSIWYIICSWSWRWSWRWR